MKKKSIIVIVSICVAILVVGGIGIAVLKNNSNKSVDVYPVSSIYMEGYSEMGSSYGIVTNNISQDVVLAEKQEVSEVFVEEGQEVKEGDKLLACDTTDKQTELELKELGIRDIKNDIELSNRKLTKLRNTTPVADVPEEPVSEEPDIEDEPTTQEEEIPQKTGSAYNILDTSAEPFEGKGTSESPFRYLCTESAYISGELINVLVGYNKVGTKEKTKPKTAVFEVHKNNKEKGEVIYSWTLNSENFKPVDPHIRWSIQGYQIEEDTDDEEENSESGDAEDWDDSGEEETEDTGVIEYTQQELKDEIAEEEKALSEAQFSLKEAELEYEKLKKEIEDSVFYSKINGVVKKIDTSQQAQNGETAYIKISGSEGLYIKGGLNEFMLSEVEVGQKIMATSPETGESYEAEIKEISKYPDTSGNYWSDNLWNLSVSQYPFSAYVENAEGLVNGSDVEIKIAADSNQKQGIYIQMEYVREERGRKFVFIADENNKLKKQYVKIGTILDSWAYEVTSGLALEDRIAFPYGKNVKDGVKVKDAEESDMSSFGY